jgi:hypothetical protein
MSTNIRWYSIAHFVNQGFRRHLELDGIEVMSPGEKERRFTDSSP